MQADELKRLERWVAAWKAAGPELERIRMEEVRRTDTVRAILSLSEGNPDFQAALPPRPTSGLVEQQALFRKLRHR